MSMKERIHKQLLMYGKFIKDIEFDADDGCHRIRIISYLGFIYYHHMINGEINEITILGRE